MNWFTEGDFETSFLRTAVVFTAIGFLVTVALQIDNATSGEAVSLPILVATFGGFLATLMALLTTKLDANE